MTTSPLHPLEISPQEVKQMLDHKRAFFFVDCRTEDEHEEANIEGAKLMPMQDLDLHMDELERHREELIVIHCRSGKRSLNVVTALHSRGFPSVKSMAGGIRRWAEEIDPSVPRV